MNRRKLAREIIIAREGGVDFIPARFSAEWRRKHIVEPRLRIIEKRREKLVRDIRAMRDGSRPVGREEILAMAAASLGSMPYPFSPRRVIEDVVSVLSDYVRIEWPEPSAAVREDG